MIMPWWVQLFGLLIAVGGVGCGAIYGLWRLDTKSHDWKTCWCESCKFKRRKRDLARDAAEKRKALRQKYVDDARSTGLTYLNTDPSKMKTDSKYFTTAQLEEGMVVGMQGMDYLVLEMIVGPAGYTLKMENVATRQPFVTQVAFEIGNMKIWKPRGSIGHGKPPWM